MERPSRSDAHLSVEDAARIAGETREHFDELAPKRHTKPQRSEYSSRYEDVNDEAGDVIPEYAAFQRLENDQEVLVLLSLNAVFGSTLLPLLSWLRCQ